MRRRLPTLLLAAALVLAACSNGDDDAADVAPTEDPPDAAEAPRESAGCLAPSLGSGAQSLVVDGVVRQYSLSVPADPTGPLPVIVDLHGLGSNGGQQEALGQMAAMGSERGFAVATPDSARVDRGWAIPTVAGDRSDAELVGAILDELEARLCIDPGREFASGISNGAGLALGMVCALDGRLAGVAPVAGVSLDAGCDDPEPTTIIAFHGTEDEWVPYDGGTPLEGAEDRFPALAEALSGLDLPPVEDVVDRWAEAFGCRPAVDEPVGDDVTHRTFPGCDDGVRVELYRVEGGGHTWPGGLAVERLGRTTTSISATALILDAFASASA